MMISNSFKLLRDKRQPLSPYHRGIIVGMRVAKWRVSDIRKETGLSETAIRATLKAAEDEHWIGESKPHPGRPRKTTSVQDDELRNYAILNPNISYAELSATVLPTSSISLSTVQRRLKEADIKKRRALKKTALKERDAQLRLAWALAHRNWPMEKWKRTIWSDEVTVQRGGGGRRNWVFRSG